VHLGADPLGIGRITTAVGQAGGTVLGVDIVESHPDLLVVDLTCNAADARHAEVISEAVTAVPAPMSIRPATATCRSCTRSRALPDVIRRPPRGHPVPSISPENLPRSDPARCTDPAIVRTVG
jgi:hypothetical protein